MQDERQGRLKSYIECPRWAGFPTYLKNVCFKLDLELNMSVDKHIIMETVRFEIKGSESKLRACKSEIDRAIKEYNS